ncbi:MAG: VOC family protein [Candidatus Bathyarchaeota archaeon]|nr:VOC family protein [Candidatus Bathyarchaeota archaeon]
MNGICYVEIPTTNSHKSREFYKRVFEWKMDVSENDYVMFTTPDNEGGGFNTSNKPSQDGVILYIEVEDIEKKLKDIEEAGGKRVKDKTKISDEFGFYALFTDPCENIIGLWANK